MKNECRKLIFLLFSSSRVDLFVKKQNCRNLSLIRLAARETREVKEEFDACSGRLTEACNFKTPRLQCYFGFDEVRKKLDTLRLLSFQKICHLVIVMKQGVR